MCDLERDLIFNFGRHKLLGRRFAAREFLEARIIPERIEHWIEPEQRRSERRRNDPVAAGYLQDLLECGYGPVRFAHLCCDASQRFALARTDERILLHRISGDTLFGESKCSSLVAEAHVSQR